MGQQQQFPMQPFFRQTPLSVDTAHAQRNLYDDEETGSLLEDGMLDHSGVDSGLDMSPPMVDSRRESFAVGGSLFSPKQEDWQQSVEMQSVPSNNPFAAAHGNNPFLQQSPDQSQPQGFGHQGGQWSMSNSGSATPLPQFDGLPVDYETSSSLFRGPSLPGQTPFGHANAAGLFSGVGGPSMPSPPKDHWMGAGPMSKKMRPGSPSGRSHNELRRGDGIRKKNARFEIPAERNLSNIDQLIASSNDDQEIKELKQQKRLLRNRQAALDSRQRKKQHTERLEDEKKHYTAIVSDLEDDVDRLRREMAELFQEKARIGEYIETLNLEKEEMIRAHTIETGELRKKISVLTGHVQSLESAALPAALQTGHFPGSAPFGDMDGMSGMDTSGWDGMGGFMADYGMDPVPAVPEVKPEMQMVPVKKSDAMDADKPSGQGGLLLMLFLVGAFVLSNQQATPIPRVSEDVRAASRSILENVLKDAGVQSAPVVASMPAAPQPSSWAATPHRAMTGLDGVAPSMLGDLTDALTQPTQEQTNEQLFSLNAAQYSGVMGHDDVPYPPPPPEQRATSQGRRNLAEALSALRTGSKAEVYTRSLLWDQIPRDVVHNFARMVAESNPQSNAEGGGGSSAADGSR